MQKPKPKQKHSHTKKPNRHYRRNQRNRSNVPHWRHTVIASDAAKATVLTNVTVAIANRIAVTVAIVASLHDTNVTVAIHTHTHNTFAVIRAIDNTDIDFIDTYVKSQATRRIASHRCYCQYPIAAAVAID
jgi:hypothetical protein